MRRTALNRSVMRRAARSTGACSDVVDAVLERDQHSCVVCGNNLHGARGRDWSLHHRRPRGMGGTSRPDTNLPANLVCLCGSGTSGCHGWVESRRTEAMEMGLILHHNDNPAEHPVATWYGAVLLDNDGGLWPITGEEAL